MHPTSQSQLRDALKTPSKRHTYTRSVADDIIVNIQSKRGNKLTKLGPKHIHTQHACYSTRWRSYKRNFTPAIRVGRHVDFLFVKAAAHTHTHTYTHITKSSHPVLASAREQLGYWLAGLPVVAYSVRRVGPASKLACRPLI